MGRDARADCYRWWAAAQLSLFIEIRLKTGRVILPTIVDAEHRDRLARNAVREHNPASIVGHVQLRQQVIARHVTKREAFELFAEYTIA